MLLIILAPLAIAALALAAPSNRRRPAFLLAGAVLHAGGVAALFVSPPHTVPGAWPSCSSGPATPVAAMPTSAPSTRCAPTAISIAHCSLTTCSDPWGRPR